MRGDGRVYRVKGSRFWHIEFPGPRPGQPVRETTEETTRSGALRILRERRGEASQARLGKGNFERRDLTVAQLVAEVLDDLDTRGKASARTMRSHSKHVIEHLGAMRALDVDRATIQRYQKRREGETPKPSAKTINHEVSLISRAFHLAEQDGKVSRTPTAPKLETARRTVSIGTSDLYAILERVREESDDLADWLEFFAVTGARNREISTLEWGDYADGLLTIRKENAKIRKARAIPVIGVVAEIIKRRSAARRTDSPLIFHAAGRSLQKPKAEGLPDWALDRWHAAVGSLDLIPYDLRRHANDLLMAAGVDFEIRSMLIGQKPPGQNPNYLDFTRPPVTDRFKDAILAATAQLAKQRQLPRKLASIGTRTEDAKAAVNAQ
jgi:integrase